MELEQLKYPVGKWIKPTDFNPKAIIEQIQIIREFPAKIISKANSFSEKQLEETYRSGGWTARQVIHHCADSHMNAFIRFKLALTEDLPTIKPYAEAAWAELVDAKHLPLNSSLQILEGLHFRWSTLLDGIQEKDWHRGFIHPEHGHELKLYEVVSLYSWHCRHHYGHLEII